MQVEKLKTSFILVFSTDKGIYSQTHSFYFRPPLSILTFLCIQKYSSVSICVKCNIDNSCTDV